VTQPAPIPGGYVLLARVTLDSRVWTLGPDVGRLAEWMIITARHSHEPKRYVGFDVARGELITSLADIAEACAWMENRKERQWTRQKVMRLLAKLCDAEFCLKISDTYGTHLRVCNYERYQLPDAYKSDSNGTPPEQQRNNSVTTADTYNKGNNGENGNNGKNENTQERVRASESPQQATGKGPELSAEDKRLGAFFADIYQEILECRLGRLAPFADLFIHNALESGVKVATIEDVLAWLPEHHGETGVPGIKDPRHMASDWFGRVVASRKRIESRAEENKPRDSYGPQYPQADPAAEEAERKRYAEATALTGEEKDVDINAMMAELNRKVQQDEIQ